MLSSEEKSELLYLRLLIARAAQKDSLNWWEDDSLTDSGGYLLDRLFPYSPQLTGRKLALEAASTRCRSIFNFALDTRHLYRLDASGEIEYFLHDFPLLEIEVPVQPIVSFEILEQFLKEKTGPAPKFRAENKKVDHSMEIRLVETKTKPSLIILARALAWASLAGRQGEPVFPYIRTE